MLSKIEQQRVIMVSEGRSPTHLRIHPKAWALLRDELKEYIKFPTYNNQGGITLLGLQIWIDESVGEGKAQIIDMTPVIETFARTFNMTGGETR
jgi:hypothetical protein